jgi:hypothetical protein
MTPSLRKKIVSSIISQWKVQETLELMDILLVMMKKFWKQLSQTPVKEFFEKNYPDVAKLYILLWESRFTIKHCLLLKQYLCESLGESFLISESSDASVKSQLAQVDERIMVNIWGDGSNPVLSIHSPAKIYKRSLYDDLQKLL